MELWEKFYLKAQENELLLNLSHDDVELLKSCYPTLSDEDILNEARHAYEWLEKQGHQVAVRHFFSKWLARHEMRNKGEYEDTGKWVKYEVVRSLNGS